MSFEDDIRDAMHRHVDGLGDGPSDTAALATRLGSVVRQRRMAFSAGAAVLALGMVFAVPRLVSAPEDAGRAQGSVTVSCGNEDFPASALESPADAEMRSGPAEDALRDLLEDPGRSELAAGADSGWRELSRSSGRVAFGRGEPPRLQLVVVEERKEGWRWTRQGPCDTLIEFDGIWPAAWTLDPAFPRPTADSTVIHVLVDERQCHGSEPSLPRLMEPQITSTSAAVEVALYVQPLLVDATCPGAPAEATTIDLGEPLGDRLLLDGGTFPATRLR